MIVNFFHEKKYLFSREKIFLFMKKNIYYRESKLLITVNAFSIYSPLDVMYCVIRCQKCFVFIC